MNLNGAPVHLMVSKRLANEIPCIGKGCHEVIRAGGSHWLTFNVLITPFKKKLTRLNQFINTACTTRFEIIDGENRNSRHFLQHIEK